LKLKTSFSLYEKLIFLAYFIYSGTSAGNLINGDKSGNIMEAVRYLIIFPYLMFNGSFGSYFIDNFTLAASVSGIIGLIFLRGSTVKSKTE